MVQLEHLKRSASLKVMGLLHEIKGPKGKLFYNPTNFKGTARVLLVIKFENGEEGDLFCSPAVSKHLRNKTMSTAQLLSMPVVEGKTKPDEDGKQEIIYSVTLPGSEIKEMKDVQPEAWKNSQEELEEMVVL